MRLLATIKKTKDPVIIVHFFTCNIIPKAVILNGDYLEECFLDELEAVTESKECNGCQS